MRLLIDENLSEAIVLQLASSFPGSLHVRQLGFGGATDQQVWQLAQQHQCVLLTRDEDFLRLSMFRGAPPKVILLRIGNCSNEEVVRLLLDRFAIITEFEASADATVLELA